MGLQSDQKIVVNFIWLTTLMPFSGQTVCSFELKLNKQLLDKVEKQFLSNKRSFYQKNVVNFFYVDYLFFQA